MPKEPFLDSYPIQQNVSRRPKYKEHPTCNYYVPKKQERAIVTVMGQDRVGFVAGISQITAEHGVNIIDLTSTEMRGLFIMIILVDTATSKTPMNELQEALRKKGEALGVQVMAQHEDVFRYMHRI